MIIHVYVRIESPFYYRDGGGVRKDGNKEPHSKPEMPSWDDSNDSSIFLDESWSGDSDEESSCSSVCKPQDLPSTSLPSFQSKFLIEMSIIEYAINGCDHCITNKLIQGSLAYTKYCMCKTNSFRSHNISINQLIEHFSRN